MPGPMSPAPARTNGGTEQRALSAEESVGTLTRRHLEPLGPDIFLKRIRECIHRIFTRAHAACQTVSSASGNQR